MQMYIYNELGDLHNVLSIKDLTNYFENDNYDIFVNMSTSYYNIFDKMNNLKQIYSEKDTSIINIIIVKTI